MEVPASGRLSSAKPVLFAANGGLVLFGSPNGLGLIHLIGSELCGSGNGQSGGLFIVYVSLCAPSLLRIFASIMSSRRSAFVFHVPPLWISSSFVLALLYPYPPLLPHPSPSSLSVFVPSSLLPLPFVIDDRNHTGRSLLLLFLLPLFFRFPLFRSQTLSGRRLAGRGTCAAIYFFFSLRSGTHSHRSSLYTYLAFASSLFIYLSPLLLPPHYSNFKSWMDRLSLGSGMHMHFPFFFPLCTVRFWFG